VSYLHRISLGFILGDLNEYLRDLRPYFSNYACLGFDCRFEWVKPSNRRKNEVEGHVDQRNLQRRFKMTQHRQNLCPKLKHQRSTKHCVEEASRPGGTEPTTARGGGTHDHAPRAWPPTAGLLAFFRDFSFFDGLCPLNCNESGLIQDPIHSHPLSFHLH